MASLGTSDVVELVMFGAIGGHPHTTMPLDFTNFTIDFSKSAHEETPCVSFVRKSW